MSNTNINKNTRQIAIENAYKLIIDQLTPNQLFELTAYNDLIGQVNMAKKVSKSREVHYLVNVILYLVNSNSELDAKSKYSVARACRGIYNE